MKFHLQPKAAVRDGDTPSMRNDIAFLLEQGIDVRRPAKGNGQLKLDPNTSYYPGKGTFSWMANLKHGPNTAGPP